MSHPDIRWSVLWHDAHVDAVAATVLFTCLALLVGIILGRAIYPVQPVFASRCSYAPAFDPKIPLDFDASRIISSPVFFSKGLHCPALEPREDDVSHPYDSWAFMVRDLHLSEGLG